jgi:hypothetical protein
MFFFAEAARGGAVRPILTYILTAVEKDGEPALLPPLAARRRCRAVHCHFNQSQIISRSSSHRG